MQTFNLDNVFNIDETEEASLNAVSMDVFTDYLKECYEVKKELDTNGKGYYTSAIIVEQ